jgi:hypothetical protein
MGLDSGEARNRTGDTVIFSHVLYRLSYLAGYPWDGSGGRVVCPARVSGAPLEQNL